MQYDVIIVGGGAVGLATALQLTNQNPSLKIVLLEKESVVANHQTGNNSNVIHSGVYYKPGSLKAVNCIRGYKMLLEFCDENNVPYDLCGKIVVATSEKEQPDGRYEFGFGRYAGRDAALSYWRLASGIEVDFVVGDMQVAIEAKSSERITRDHLNGLRALKEDHPRVGRRVVVCREPRARRTEDGIEILPTKTFVRKLWEGGLFESAPLEP